MSQQHSPAYQAQESPFQQPEQREVVRQKTPGEFLLEELEKQKLEEEAENKVSLEAEVAQIREYYTLYNTQLRQSNREAQRRFEEAQQEWQEWANLEVQIEAQIKSLYAEIAISAAFWGAGGAGLGWGAKRIWGSKPSEDK